MKTKVKALQFEKNNVLGFWLVRNKN